MLSSQSIINPAGFAKCFMHRLLVTVLCCAAIQAQAAPADQPAIEYQVKASLIFNFMHFIEWPEDAFSNNSQITICQIGQDMYGKALRVLDGEIAQGKTLVVKNHSAWSANLANICQVAIFSGQERALTQTALTGLDKKTILTIGETSGFLQDGGIIKFSIIDDTVQFEINLLSAKQARLVISSKLLRLANNVITPTSEIDYLRQIRTLSACCYED
jgi:hypothetical protein